MVESRSTESSIQVVSAIVERTAREKRLVLSQVLEILNRRFNQTELRDLCFHLRSRVDGSVDYDNLAGETKADKARELVAYLDRRCLIPKLLEIGKKLRTDISWPTVSREVSSAFWSVQREQTPGRRGYLPAKPEEAGSFARDVPVGGGRRRRIINKMSQTVYELRTYVKRYSQAVDAYRLSIILFEQVPTDWEGYWRDTCRVYDEATRLANKMARWKKIRRSAGEMSAETRRLRDEFDEREDRVLAMVRRHKSEHDEIQKLLSELRRIQDKENEKPLLMKIHEKVKGIKGQADGICDELYNGIEALITEELDAQLRELGQPGIEGG